MLILQMMLATIQQANPPLQDNQQENSMNLQETMTMTGKLNITVRDESGEVKQSIDVPNLVVTAGKVYIASRMVGTSATVMNGMAIGTGTETPAVGDTGLATEAGRVALSTFTASTNAVTATATFPAGTGTGAITEAGIFNNSSTGGTMLCRTTFPVVNKAAGDSIAITWVITVS
jgi:hypothetical protein